MNFKIVFSTILLLLSVTSLCQGKKKSVSSIVIEGNVPDDFFNKASAPGNTVVDRIELGWVPADHVSVHPKWNSVDAPLSNGLVKWTFHSGKPVFVYSPYLSNVTIFYPGDSVRFSYVKDSVFVNGRGAKAIELQLIINRRIRERIGPTKNESTINSIEDFYQWGKSLNQLSADVLKLIRDYKQRVPDRRLNFIKVKSLYKIESYRVTTLSVLSAAIWRNKELITPTRLVHICDSVLNAPVSKWLRQQNTFFGEILYFYEFIRLKAWSQSGFDLTNEAFNSPSKRRRLYYDLIKDTYKGLLRERVMQYLIVRDLINELKYADSVRINILRDYYAQPSFPNYKASVKDYEAEAEMYINLRKEKRSKRDAERQKYSSYDGPYLYYDYQNVLLAYFDSSKLKITKFDSVDFAEDSQTFNVRTDRYSEVFRVSKKRSLQVEPSVYERPQQLLALSDIEGNFKSFRSLLQKNGVIDEHFNWIFGSGHLVFAGDMFDRGHQVTECLWLMYSLEEKAKAAGGYVHFVLGNHEIMNMQGSHEYTSEKYHQNSKLLGKTLQELYNEDSELGRWLRTKNVIEKIGDMLFVHGGISPEVNRLPLDIEEINKAVRPYYGTKPDSSNATALVLYDSRFGEKYRISPFWSRGYYKSRSENGLISSAQLDSTFQKFGVNRIITGHTIVADTISVHYGGKVINTDTKHAEGKSEALLIEGDHFYRVNDKAERKLLFVDDRKKVTTLIMTNSP